MTRLLIIDDDQSIRALVARTVAADFDSVFQAVDGLDGLTAAAREEPDIVLLDLDMPRLSGSKRAEPCAPLRRCGVCRSSS